jgi:hypothetical protein
MRSRSGAVRAFFSAVIAAAVLASACGGDGAGASSGVAGDKRLDSLTADEKAKLCDWGAAKFGGYGHTTDCGDGYSISAVESQAACVAGLPEECDKTVADVEQCANDVSCQNPGQESVSCQALAECS